MSRPFSVGVLHPTFESWGGAEWFIHGLLTTWAASGEIKAALYTYRWSDPPGEKVDYPVVAHGFGGIVSGPWDWRAVGRHLSPRWKHHDVLFVHNHPAGEWVRCADNAPPFVWYSHEPPRSLWDTAGERSVPGGVSSMGSKRLTNLMRLGFSRGTWRVSSRLRLILTRRVLGCGEWENRLRVWDLETVGSAAAIIANSRFTAGRIEEVYGREATVAYPLLPRFQPGTFLATAEKKPIVLWVGRLAHEKRPELMLRAWQLTVAHEGLERFKLVLVGDGPLRSSIEAQLAPLVASGHAEFRRHIPADELRMLYRQAILTVYLGRNEPFGLVPLESTWEGTPVLADCQGGVRETVIPGETGYCLGGATVATLASSLKDLLAHPAELQSLGSGAATLVRQRFSFEKTLDIIGQELKNTAASHHS